MMSTSEINGSTEEQQQQMDRSAEKPTIAKEEVENLQPTSKIPCLDENDDGVPPFFRFPWCPLDHRNQCFNTSKFALMFGNLGFPYFDKNRKLWMGISSISTILSMGITMYGCFALSKFSNIITDTYWARAKVYSGKDEDDTIYGFIYIGLRSAVEQICENVENGAGEGWECAGGKFTEQRIDFDDAKEIDEKSQIYKTFFEESDSTCYDVSVSFQITAFMTCFTLIFALMGTLNRRKVKSDAPVQKILGSITDTWGAGSLAYSLIQFSMACYVNVDRENNGAKLFIERGPGFICYCLCSALGFIRAIIHWLTPLPDEGVGCCNLQLPNGMSQEELADILKLSDLNGDGVVDYRDVLIAMKKKGKIGKNKDKDVEDGKGVELTA